MLTKDDNKSRTPSEVTLAVRQEEDRIYLAIEDRGAGIKALDSAKRSSSHGMTIMRERAEAFGGNFSVYSTPGQGTKIEARVPIDVDDQKQSKEKNIGDFPTVAY